MVRGKEVALTKHDAARKQRIIEYIAETVRQRGYPPSVREIGDAVGLTPSDDMVLKSSYYSAAQLGRLKGLAERQKKKEAALLREALDDLLRKHERS